LVVVLVEEVMLQPAVTEIQAVQVVEEEVMEINLLLQPVDQELQAKEIQEATEFIVVVLICLLVAVVVPALLVVIILAAHQVPAVPVQHIQSQVQQ
jgi:hypothetical protein